jgi:cytochrome P450
MLRFPKEQSPSVVVACCLGGIYLLYHLVQTCVTAYQRHLFKREKGCKPEPRYPHLESIFGIDIFLENLRLSKTGGFLDAVSARYKRVGEGIHTYSSLLTGERVIQTCEPENIKAILATQFKDFNLPSGRKKAFAPIFGHGIFTTDGKEWEASRALLRPNFNRSQVGDLDTFESHITKLIERIPRDGSTVDLQPLFFMLTMDSATEFLFGHSAGSLEIGASHERGIKFAQAFTDSTEKTGKMARLGKFGGMFKDKEYIEDVKFVHEYVQEYVQKAVNLHKTGKQEKFGEGKSKYVFLEELAQTGYNEKKIQDELLNILLAGRDTTASLLSYLFYTLARQPEIFNKLRSEVMELGDKRPTFEQIKSCKYLQWVLNEGELPRY